MNSTTGLANGTIAARRRAFDRHTPGDIVPSPMSRTGSPCGSPLTSVPSPGRLQSPNTPSPTGKTSRMLQELQNELDSTKAQLERSKLEVRSCRREIGTLLRREGDSKDMRERMRSESEALNSVIERKERIAADALERVRAAENAAAHHMEERQAIEERAGERVARAEAGRAAAEGGQARAEAEACALRDSVRSLREVWARDVAECRREMERLARQMRSEREDAAAKRKELLELVQAQAIEHQGIASLVEQMEVQRVKAARAFQMDTEHFEAEIGSLRAAMARSEEDAEQARTLARELSEEVARLRQVNTRSVAEHIRKSSMEERKAQVERGTQPDKRDGVEAGAQTEWMALPASPHELPQTVMRDAETQFSSPKSSSAPLVAAAAIATAAVAVPGVVGLARSTSRALENSHGLELLEEAPLARNDSISEISALLECPPSPSTSDVERELSEPYPPCAPRNEVSNRTLEHEQHDPAPIVVLLKPVDSDLESDADTSDHEVVIVPSPACLEEEKAKELSPHQPEPQSPLQMAVEVPGEAFVEVESSTRQPEAGAERMAPAQLSEVPPDGEDSPLTHALRLVASGTDAERTSEADGYESGDETHSANDSIASISSPADVYPGDYSPGPYSPAPYSPSGYSYSPAEYSSAGYSPYSPAFSSRAASIQSTYSDEDGTMNETVENEAPAAVKTDDEPEAVVVIGAFDTVDTFVTVPASPEPAIADGEGSPDSAALPDALPVRDATHNVVPEMRTSIDSDKTVYDAEAAVHSKAEQSAARDLPHMEPSMDALPIPQLTISVSAVELAVEPDTHVAPVVTATAVAALPVAAVLHNMFAPAEPVHGVASVLSIEGSAQPRDLIDDTEHLTHVEAAEPVEPGTSDGAAEPDVAYFNETVEVAESPEPTESGVPIDSFRNAEPSEPAERIASAIPMSPAADLSFTTPTPLESLLPDTTPDRYSLGSVPSPDTTQLVTPESRTVSVARDVTDEGLHALYNDLDGEDKHDEELTPTPRGYALPVVPLVVIQDSTPISSEPHTPIAAVATPAETLPESHATREIEKDVPALMGAVEHDIPTESAVEEAALPTPAVKPEGIALPEDVILPQDIPLPGDNFRPEEIPLPEDEDDILFEDAPLPVNDLLDEKFALPWTDLMKDGPRYEKDIVQEAISSPVNVLPLPDSTSPKDVRSPQDIPLPGEDFLPEEVPLPESVADTEELRDDDESIFESHGEYEANEQVEAIEDILASSPVFAAAAPEEFTTDPEPSIRDIAESHPSTAAAAIPQSPGSPPRFLDVAHDTPSPGSEGIVVPAPAADVAADSRARSVAGDLTVDADENWDRVLSEAEASPSESVSALATSTSGMVNVPTPSSESDDGDAANTPEDSGDSDWASINASEESADASLVISVPTDYSSPAISVPELAVASPEQLTRSLSETPVHPVSIALPASPAASPVVHATPLAVPTDLSRSVEGPKIVSPAAVSLPDSPIEESIAQPDSESEYDSETDDGVPFEGTEEPTLSPVVASTTSLDNVATNLSRPIDPSNATVAPTALLLPDSPIEESFGALSDSESECDSEPERLTFEDVGEPAQVEGTAPPFSIPPTAGSPSSIESRETSMPPTAIPLPDSPIDEFCALSDSESVYGSEENDESADTSPFPVPSQGVAESPISTSSLEDTSRTATRSLDQPPTGETTVAPIVLPSPYSPTEETFGVENDSESEYDSEPEAAALSVEESTPPPTLLDVPMDSTRSIGQPPSGHAETHASPNALPLPDSLVENTFVPTPDSESEYDSEPESEYNNEGQEGLPATDVAISPLEAFAVPLPESPVEGTFTLSPECPAMNADELPGNEHMDLIVPLPDTPASASSSLPVVASRSFVEGPVDVNAPSLLEEAAHIEQSAPIGSAASSLPDVPDTPFSEVFPSPTIAPSDVVEAPADADVPLLFSPERSVEMISPAERMAPVGLVPEAPETPTFETFPHAQALPLSPVTTPVERARNAAPPTDTPAEKYIDAQAYLPAVGPVSPATIALPVSPQDSPVLTELPLTLSPLRELVHDNAIDSAVIPLPASPADSPFLEAPSPTPLPREVDATPLPHDEGPRSDDMRVPDSPMSEYLDSPSFSFDEMSEESTIPVDFSMPPPTLMPLSVVPGITTPTSEWLGQEFPTADALTTRAQDDLDDLGATPPTEIQLIEPVVTIVPEPKLDITAVSPRDVGDDLTSPFYSPVESRIALAGTFKMDVPALQPAAIPLPATPVGESSSLVDETAPIQPTKMLPPLDIASSAQLELPSEATQVEDVSVSAFGAAPEASAVPPRDSPQDEFYDSLDSDYDEEEGDVDVNEFFASPPSEPAYLQSDLVFEPEVRATANAWALSLPDSPAEGYFTFEEDNSLQLSIAGSPLTESAFETAVTSQAEPPCTLPADEENAEQSEAEGMSPEVETPAGASVTRSPTSRNRLCDSQRTSLTPSEPPKEGVPGPLSPSSAALPILLSAVTLATVVSHPIDRDAPAGKTQTAGPTPEPPRRATPASPQKKVTPHRSHRSSRSSGSFGTSHRQFTITRPAPAPETVPEVVAETKVDPATIQLPTSPFKGPAEVQRLEAQQAAAIALPPAPLPKRAVAAHHESPPNPLMITAPPGDGEVSPGAPLQLTSPGSPIPPPARL